MYFHFYISYDFGESRQEVLKSAQTWGDKYTELDDGSIQITTTNGFDDNDRFDVIFSFDDQDEVVAMKIMLHDD